MNIVLNFQKCHTFSGLEQQCFSRRLLFFAIPIEIFCIFIFLLLVLQVDVLIARFPGVSVQVRLGKEN